MNELEIEKLRQIVSRTDKTGNEKVEMLIEFTEQQVKNLNIPAVITPFWLWLVRKANIDVIDAETAIEVRGFLEEGDMLVPVITFAELLELYKSQNGL